MRETPETWSWKSNRTIQVPGTGWNPPSPWILKPHFSPCVVSRLYFHKTHPFPLLPPRLCRFAVLWYKPAFPRPPFCACALHFHPITVCLGRLPGGWVLSTRCREEGGRERALACPENLCKEPYPTGSRPPCRRETEHLRLRQPVPAMKGEPAPQKEHDVSTTSGSPDPPVMRSDSDSHSSSRSASTHVSL